ncbi:ribosomal protein L10 [Ceratobasidium sp. AG-Ba]|nr:ribosomal protein L10 [Ceratobasidium sp. AG-Ba]
MIRSPKRWITVNAQASKRAYAATIPISPPKPPKPPPPPADPNRAYTPRKSALYAEYSSAVQNSPFFLILGHENFSVAKFTALRKELAKVNPTTCESTPARISVIRHAIFGAAVKSTQPRAMPLLAAVQGPAAMLAFPTLDPPQLKSILRALERAVPKAKSEQSSAPRPTLRIIGGYVDGQVMQPEGLQNLSNLPTLDTLRAQLVGLLSAPAAQIAGVLDQARGGRLSRTLDGLRASLEESSKKEV